MPTHGPSFKFFTFIKIITGTLNSHTTTTLYAIMLFTIIYIVEILKGHHLKKKPTASTHP